MTKKHVHIHIHTNDGDPYNRDEIGQFATTSGGAAHHTKQAQSHRQHATSKGEGHPDHPDHIRAFSSHTRAANNLRLANEADNTGKGREQIPGHMAEAEREAQGAKGHERNLRMESAQGESNAPKGGLNWKEPAKEATPPAPAAPAASNSGESEALFKVVKEAIGSRPAGMTGIDDEKVQAIAKYLQGKKGVDILRMSDELGIPVGLAKRVNEARKEHFRSQAPNKASTQAERIGSYLKQKHVGLIKR